MKNNFILYILFNFILITSLTGCRDDDMPSFDYGIGETEIAVEVKFEPLSAALGETRTPGNAIKGIETLSVIVYNSDDELIKVFNDIQLLQSYSYSVDGNDKMPVDGNGNPIGDQAEATTAKASFTLPALPYGRYKIYAIANMGSISDEDAMDINNLKQKEVVWNPSDIAKNNQMFGYFSLSDDQNNRAYGFDAPIVVINKNNKSIHAWIKRAASKVTVAFDPSGLKQDVWIYIHDVSIRDIPAYCKLGADNTPTSYESLLNSYDTPLSELPASSKIIYGENGELADGSTDPYQDFKNDVPETVYSKWLTLAKGSGIKGSDHSETANALYFFENMQGDYEGNKKYDKQVPATEIDGVCITEPGQEGYKNNIEYGTYIEVTGYYVSQNAENTTKGKIKYRFMLGKNTTYNFNSQRNHHFKLTLGFEGWANQPKWNIEYYEEDPGLYVPDQFYVSYLYNTKHMMPIKIVGNCLNLEMRIVENNWAPYDPSTPDEVPAQIVGIGDYAFKWNRPAWKKMYKQKTIYDNTPESQLTNPTWFGFLALAVPINSGLPDKNIVERQFSDGSTAQDDLKKYFTTNNGVNSWNTGSQEKRVFNESQLKYDGPENGAFYTGLNGWQVTKVDEDSKMLMVPLFTRNKSMIIGSGFSGNNPYDSYQRKAVVRIKGTFRTKGGGTTEIVRLVPIYQVMRIVNPKGVWHRYDDRTDFDVNLLRIPDVSATSSANYFMPFNSEGAWKAYVEVKGKDFLSLEPNGKSYKIPGVTDTIYGDTDTPMEFKLKFNGVGNNESACAVVRVDYNGYHCVHRIMVRQGYMAPLAVVGNTKWSSFSLYSCSTNAATSGTPSKPIAATMTVNPLALGTFFKRHNTQEGILIKNNNNLGPLVAPNGFAFELTNKTYKSWEKIPPYDDNTDNSTSDYTSTWGTFTSTVNNEKRTYRLPTYEDFKALEEAEFGFGVLYTDGTTSTQTTYEQAYGYQAPNNLTDGPDTGKGARGVIVYNRTNGNQIFFPVGKNGMGRRTQFNVKLSSSANNLPEYFGVLRYADVSYVLDAVDDDYRPVPYNLPRTPGALYWINTIKQNGNDNQWPVAGWDMNYFSFDFNSYPDNARSRLKDARPIKLIVTN